MTTPAAFHNPGNDQLLFIVGGPKTASTSLCGLVNCHPDVFVMCEVNLDERPISRYGKRLVRSHPDMRAFFSDDSSDPLQTYRQAQRHLAARGFAKLMFGDKFVGIDLGYSKKVGSARVLYTVRYLPEWLAKDSVRAEYQLDEDIVPVAVLYTKHFIESFSLDRVLHVRTSDFLGDNQGVVDSIWKFLGITKPAGGNVWWESIAKYAADDPKSAINWWRGHASSTTEPRGTDTLYELIDTPFWQRIVPIFNKYYDAAGGLVLT